MTKPSNRFDRMEWAGAFGDLGTFIPFLVSYLAVVRMDASSVLFAFGASMLMSGLYYRTPFPVQPMKAIGAMAATQAAQTLTITPATICSASLVTGVAWLTLGLTGAARRVGAWAPRYVVSGIILGLGLGFMVTGIKMMSDGWLIACIAMLGAVALLRSKVFPAMFFLLLFAVGAGIIRHPNARDILAGISVKLSWPQFALDRISWKDLAVGAALLALPQLPLTLGNAVIAVTEENNRLFPDRLVTENKVATSTGLMNVWSAALGGVPMCHGAGGMAGHVAFGAKTGGAPIILGTFLLMAALFLGGSIQFILGLFPRAVLGVILFLTGGQLISASVRLSESHVDRCITFVTAAVSMWNVGLGFVIGVGLALSRDRFRAPSAR